jgi:hypothetical protein
MLGGGTGNLLTVSGKLYISTCFHVAEGFFASNQFRYATLRKNVRILKSDLRLVGYKNGELDVALIEVLASAPDYPSYGIDNLEVMESFESASLQKTDIMICGMPGQLAKDEPHGVLYTPVTFLTLPFEEKLPSTDFLYCQYPTEGGVVETHSGQKLKLPAAPGFSGAFMLKVKQFERPKDVIWTSKIAHVVAIQHRWDTKSYIKGTNIKHLIDLLPQLGAA